jgi:hypothetical protein
VVRKGKKRQGKVRQGSKARRHPEDKRRRNKTRKEDKTKQKVTIRFHGAFSIFLVWRILRVEYVKQQTIFYVATIGKYTRPD